MGKEQRSETYVLKPTLTWLIARNNIIAFFCQRNLRQSHLHGFLHLAAPSWTLPRDDDEFGPLEVKK